jgi:hypothetical protein
MGTNFKYIDAATLEVTTPAGKQVGWHELRVILTGGGSAPAGFQYVENSATPPSGTPTVPDVPVIPAATPGFNMTPSSSAGDAKSTATSRTASARTVTVVVGAPTSLTLRGLPKSSAVKMYVKVNGKWIPLGAVKTTKTGRGTAPTFTVGTAGSYLVKAVSKTGTRYVRVVAS